MKNVAPGRSYERNVRRVSSGTSKLALLSIHREVLAEGGMKGT